MSTDYPDTTARPEKATHKTTHLILRSGRILAVRKPHLSREIIDSLSVSDLYDLSIYAERAANGLIRRSKLTPGKTSDNPAVRALHWIHHHSRRLLSERTADRATMESAQ